MKPVRLLFSAISGYGYYYLKTFFEKVPKQEAVLVGVIDPEPERSGWYPELLKQQIPVFNDMASFFKEGYEADLTVISSPPHHHVPQAITALQHGSHVLMDKPAGITPNEVLQLIRISGQTGKWVEVGYQWSFSRAIQELKTDIRSGKYGYSKRLKTICLWPRDYTYYSRNNWAGRIRSGDGTLVLDSPAHNACAHFMHNLFFLTGAELHEISGFISVKASLYRAYNIESFDTISGELQTLDGTGYFFYFSHVTEKSREPEFHALFEEAEILLQPDTRHIVVIQQGKVIRNYGNPDEDAQFKKLFHAIRAVHENRSPVCPPQSAITQVTAVNAIHASMATIHTFPDHLIVAENNRRWVKNLGDELGKCYDKWEIFTNL